MNTLNSKISLLLLFCLLSNTSVKAQEENSYGRKTEKYTNVWMKLIPKYGKVQFAGSVGVLSFGGGWNYGKDKWETDFLFGFVSSKEHEPMATFTLKQNFIPWRYPINDKITFEPLTCGIYFNTLLNGDFWTKQPAKYPSDYYFFPTKIRTLAFIGERITFKVDNKFIHNKYLTLFYELSTCDLYFLCALDNRTLKPKDYISLSFGIKLQIL